MLEHQVRVPGRLLPRFPQVRNPPPRLLLRWVSLLVAEIYYPDTYFPGNPGDQPAPGREPIKASPPSDLNQYLLKRSGGAAGSGPSQNCDGYDDLGCFHVRLYYDWFLIPGSCKCWKNDFFAQYTRRK